MTIQQRTLVVDQPRGALIGYARTSTMDQAAGLEAQIRDLTAAGCTKIFQEQVSSVGERAQLERAMDYAREGDTFVVTKIDRLARSISNLVEIIASLKSRGVAVRILALGMDTESPTGQLTVNILGSVAQFEREIMLERQRVGIAAARRDGRNLGRKPSASLKSADVLAMRGDGKTPAQIAVALGIGRASVYRALEGAQAITIA